MIAHCDTDHSLVVAKLRDRLVVNKQRSHRFQKEECNLQKLNKPEGKKQYRVEVSNTFAALEDTDTQVDINNAWETIGEYPNFSQILGYF
jgi:hypothetical protein